MLQESPKRNVSLVTRVADSKAIGCGINLFIIPLLVALALVLPPLSLPDRILDAGYRTIGKSGIELKLRNDAFLVVPPESMEGVAGTVKLKFESVPAQTFLDGKASSDLKEALNRFPPNLELKGDVFLMTLKGNSPAESNFIVPIPLDSEPYITLDFYTWDGVKWDFIPGKFYYDNDMAETTLKKLPKALVIAQTKAVPPTVSAEMASLVEIPKAGSEALVEVNPLGLLVRQDGTIGGQVIAVPPSQNYYIVPTLSNLEGGVARTDFVANMMVNDRARRTHVGAISDYVVQNLLPGIDIQYLGLKPELRSYFSQFVQELSAELHARGKLLTISVPQPTPVSEDDWDTGAYDWVLIGQLADGVKIPSMTTPNAYQTDGPMDKLLAWAVSRVSRYKLQIALDTNVQDRVGGQVITRPYDDILKSLIGKVQYEGLVETYAIPWQGVTFNVSTAPGFSGFKQDNVTKALYLNYQDKEGKAHQVYIETAESLKFKMDLASRYHLKGVYFRGLLSNNIDATIWNAITTYRTSVRVTAQTPIPQYELVWTVVDGKGQQIQLERRPLNQPQFVWTAAPVADKYTIGASLSSNGKPSSAGDAVAINVAIPTPTPEPPTPTPQPTPTPAPTTPPTPRPTATPRPAQGPVVPNTAPNPNFGYGIQADPQNASAGLGNIKNMGFGWVKWQMPWKYVEGTQGKYDWGSWDQRIDQYAANGVKILLSIVKSPNWARPSNTKFGFEGPPADPNTFASFLGQVAARYKGKVQAIEVWNEQNIDNEWGGEPFDSKRYMDILCKGYAAIKAQDPSMIVVSGAMTPAGQVPPAAVDDAGYLNDMYVHGLKNCSDAIGAHPSGFANSPEIFWTGGRVHGYDDHRSFFFRNTMEEYRRIMVVHGDGNKKIWPTEFGWPVWRFTGDARFVFAQRNSLDIQAQYTVKAYQMGKAWGWVGVMFLWNLDYGVTQPDSELANFSILTRGGGTPAYEALRAMPK
jgi:hypothetical protein